MPKRKRSDVRWNAVPEASAKRIQDAGAELARAQRGYASIVTLVREAMSLDESHQLQEQDGALGFKRVDDEGACDAGDQ